MSSQTTNHLRTLIDAREICKNYGQTTALYNLSFRLKQGEILGLLGPNGAGKTTAIDIILGLLTPTSGEVRVLGKVPSRHRHSIASRINFCSGDSDLPANLKVCENLRIFARLYGVKHVEKKISALLKTFEIDHLGNRVAGALSSGEKTRLNLAKSLINDPVLLILDEPTSSLDPDMADKVRKIIKDVQVEKEMGILYTSHNMAEVEHLCDRAMFIHKGKKIVEGTPEEIRRHCSTSSLEEAFIKMVRTP
ncbi:MAG: ABC transporter ATP-binding protein [Candidatus Omnitrophota bacterium]|nr:ABC transporter ATP-binding protein [Candidatus Omnitrophota bacterium]